MTEAQPAAGPVPRLIVLNGPPGCGKSTLARRYVEDHPLALDLDIDRIRELVGGWREHPGPAGLLARAVALAAARAHLAGRHDVIVPQFLGRPEFIAQAERVARDAGAEFHEIVLLDDKENALRRFAERSRTSTDPAHLDAQRLLDRQGGAAELAAMYDRLLAVVATRPGTRVVHTAHGRVDEAYRDLLACLT
ncbi:AAA family ATPase [Micromonospora sp. NPDC023644]|uniref:AAA family ATPase n=1 Tax=Micromonospora sp. NPDC023644 TaxID=3154321 RepID=UPI0033C9821B